MQKNNRLTHIRLPVQLATILIALVTLTAGAIGVPAIWLLEKQLDQQAWRRVEQGNRTIEASLLADMSDLSNLAILAAQRPTLHRLLQSDDLATLANYLQTLQSGAGLDLALVCRGSDPIAEAGIGVDGGAVEFQACIEPTPGKIHWIADAQSPGWLLAAQAIPGITGNYRVVVGWAINADYMERLRLQSGLEAALVYDNRYMAGSFEDGQTAWTGIQSSLQDLGSGGGASGRFSLGETTYYAQRSRLESSAVEIVAALSTAEIAAAQAELARTIGLGIFVVIITASALAYYLARRLSNPLERLRVAAVKLRKGDLTTPVGTRTKVREIAQVAYALEDARSVLQHTLEALRREKEWSDHLLSSVVEGIVTLDRNGRITFFSQGAERISGWNKLAALGKHIDDVLQLADSETQTDEPGFSRSLPDAGGKPAILNVRSMGQTSILAITTAQLTPPETGRGGMALVLRDVSDTEAMRRLLADFLANITHEFRTPLSALTASIELMLDQLPDLSPDELRELLDSLRLGTLSLQTLIDNLLEGASIEAGRFRVHPRPADLNEVIQEVTRTMHPLLEKYGQKLEMRLPDELPAVRLDPRRTSQVLVNLLSNAIKWSPADAGIILTANVETNEVRVTVADCGPGIPTEHLTGVFIRFAHLEIEDQRAEYGAGLGLSVVKAIVEAQGGKVGVENRPEGGAAFWFTVPVAV